MSKQIMVVDDEASMLLLVDITLRRRGYTVIKVSDPYEALAMLDSTTPDLFVLDIMMPGMDGLELCKRIRLRPDTAEKPVIIYSARYDKRSVECSIAAGADAHLAKGSSQELVTHVQTFLA